VSGRRSGRGMFQWSRRLSIRFSSGTAASTVAPWALRAPPSPALSLSLLLLLFLVVALSGAGPFRAPPSGSRSPPPTGCPPERGPVVGPCPGPGLPGRVMARGAVDTVVRMVVDVDGLVTAFLWVVTVVDLFRVVVVVDRRRLVVVVVRRVVVVVRRVVVVVGAEVAVRRVVVVVGGGRVVVVDGRRVVVVVGAAVVGGAGGFVVVVVGGGGGGGGGFVVVVVGGGGGGGGGFVVVVVGGGGGFVVVVVGGSVVVVVGGGGGGGGGSVVVVVVGGSVVVVGGGGGGGGGSLVVVVVEHSGGGMPGSGPGGHPGSPGGPASATGALSDDTHTIGARCRGGAPRPAPLLANTMAPAAISSVTVSRRSAARLDTAPPLAPEPRPQAPCEFTSRCESATPPVSHQCRGDVRFFRVSRGPGGASRASSPRRRPRRPGRTRAG
jgi:hypothetical protein